MNGRILALAVACPALCAGQATLVDSAAQCERLVGPQQGAVWGLGPLYLLELQGRRGARITYAGVRHTHDPADSQFVAMQSTWRVLKPTIAFYEGVGNRYGASDSISIAQSGEPGLLRFLAAKDGVPAHSLAQTHRTQQLRDVLADTSALRAALATWVPGESPQHAPTSWFDPRRTSAETGSRFFNDVNRVDSMFRDVYMYRQLAAAAQDSSARIFAEVACDHIPAQAAALRCALSGQ